MTFIPLVIAWAFTLTFVIALILVLLDVAGVRRIQDEGQRKWLFRSLFGSVILAVGALFLALMLVRALVNGGAA